MDHLDVYVSPDDEMMTLDDAESGVRTLFQNQSDTGFRGRMRALALAKMLVPSAHQIRMGRERARSRANGVPWVALRRRVLDGGVPKVRAAAGRRGELGGTDDVCDAVFDAGTTAQYLDRLHEIAKAPLFYKDRSRQLAAATCPIALPARVGEHGEPNEVDRDQDMDAVVTSDCLASLLRVRLLARTHDFVGDGVQQRGLALASDRPGPAMVFDVDAYKTHLSTLRVGDTVHVMLDVPCFGGKDIPTNRKNSITRLGDVSDHTNNELRVKLQDGWQVATNKNGHVHINVGSLSLADAFVYGSTWKSGRFSRTALLLPNSPMILIPWMAHPSNETLMNIVTPTLAHQAHANTLSDSDMGAARSCVAALIQSDDVALNVRDSSIVDSLVQAAIDGALTASSEHVIDQGVLDNDNPIIHPSFRLDAVAFLSALAKIKHVRGGAKLKGAKRSGTDELVGGGPARDVAVDGEYVETFIGKWGPTSLTQALVGEDLDPSNGGDLMASMAQGHIGDMQLFVDTTPDALAAVATGVRKVRAQTHISDVATLKEVVKSIELELGQGRVRLAREIQLATAPIPMLASPFDVYRRADIDRWVTALFQRPDTYSGYRGSEEAAFESDVAHLRLTFEDRAFYKAEKMQQSPSAPNSTVIESLVSLPGTRLLFEFLVEGCEVHGLLEAETAAVLRNVQHYRPEEDTGARIRRRVDLVKRAQNRPEFRDLTHASRKALERRLVGRVHASAMRGHAVEVLHMLGALLVLLLHGAPGRITLNTKAPLNEKGRSKISKTKSPYNTLAVHVAASVERILVALGASDDVTTHAGAKPVRIDHLTAILADIHMVVEDKKAQGVPLVTENDGNRTVTRSGAIRDKVWTHFRPMISNLSSLATSKLSHALQALAALQRPFRDARPLIFRSGAQRPERYNVCCVYNLSAVVLPLPRATAKGSRPSLTRRIPTVLFGTNAMWAVDPVVRSIVPSNTNRVRPALLKEESTVATSRSSGVDTLLPNWMDKELLSFLDQNAAYEKDDALSRIASGSAREAKVAWSALASQNLARFEDLASKVALTKEKSDLIRISLLSPTVSLDGIILQGQQNHARRFLRCLVVPLMGRLANHVRDGQVDKEASRLNSLMSAHGPASDVTLMRSTLATYGEIRGLDLLMLAAGPLRAATTLRCSIQLHMGVGLVALWRLLEETGGGGLGSSVARPVVLLALDRLAESLRFACVDDSVTRRIQDQREDEKMRKIKIFERIPEEDVEFVREYRKIKPDLDWDKVETEYATAASQHVTADTLRKDMVRAEEEVAALGTYPDDERDVEPNDADQEMMEYADEMADTS